MTAALSIENLSVSYGRRRVIENLNLELKAGKTTIIKAVLGLREYDSGKISLFGHERGTPAAKKSLSYLPERFDPPWFLRGREFVRFALSLYGVKKDDEEISAAAAQLALDPKVLGNRVQTYSKGMRQKLGIMGTVLPGTPLLILDEPMSGLDPRARACVKDMLDQARAAGRTIFMSSHILSDMVEICDRVAVLAAGRLAWIGPPGDLCREGSDPGLERAFLNIVDRVQAPLAEAS